MRKALVRNCKYATNILDDTPLYCDVYVLLDDEGHVLLHESMFLANLAKLSSIETVRSTANDLLSFSIMASKIGGWKSIKQQSMTGYLHGELFLKRQYKQTTIQRHVASLKKFFDWVNLKGFVDTPLGFDWDYKHLYSKDQPDLVSYSSEQHSFNSLYIDKETFYEYLLPNVNSENPFIRRRAQIVLRLGYECGTRAHEVLSLDAVSTRQAIMKAREANNNLWATTSIKVKGKGAKNRELLLPPSFSEFIWDYFVRYRNQINGGQGFLICQQDGSQLKDPKHASTVFQTTCRNAGIVRQHRQGYHRLRKSYGTNLCQECYDTGKDPWVLLPRRLGHKNIETTKLYVQFDALRNNRRSVLKDLRMEDWRFKSIQKDSG